MSDDLGPLDWVAEAEGITEPKLSGELCVVPAFGPFGVSCQAVRASRAGARTREIV